MAQRVAVLGTGIMGRGMALTLLRDGHQVAVWNRTREKAEALANEGARVASTIPEAVEAADVVVTMPYDADAVMSVARELPGNIEAGAVWLQCATIGMEGIARVRSFAESEGLALVDSPVLGTKQPAEKGELAALVSGPADLIDKAKPVLESISAKVVRAGERVGQATALKLACNSWLAALTGAVAQSLALTEAQGLDPHLFLEAIDGGAVNSPYAQLKGGMMLEGAYPTSFALDSLAKDLSLITEAARSAGVDTTLINALSERFDAASNAGHGAEDIASVYEAFRRH